MVISPIYLLDNKFLLASIGLEVKCGGQYLMVKLICG